MKAEVKERLKRIYAYLNQDGYQEIPKSFLNVLIKKNCGLDSRTLSNYTSYLKELGIVAEKVGASHMYVVNRDRLLNEIDSLR